jgi:hypothetical protein
MANARKLLALTFLRFEHLIPTHKTSLPHRIAQTGLDKVDILRLEEKSHQ